LFELGLIIARFYQPKPKEDKEDLPKGAV